MVTGEKYVSFYLAKGILMNATETNTTQKRHERSKPFDSV